MVHLSECSTVAGNCNTETQIEMSDGTDEHFPGERGIRIRRDSEDPLSLLVLPDVVDDGVAVDGHVSDEGRFPVQQDVPEQTSHF